MQDYPGRKSHKVRNWILVGAAVAVVGGCSAAIASNAGSQPTQVSAKPEMSAPVKFPFTPKASPAKAAKPKTVTFHGHGNQTTGHFTVSGDGDYTVAWKYSGNSDSYGASDFIVTEDNENDFNAPMGLPDDMMKTSGSGSSETQGDPGRHYFNVQATGDWTITVTPQ